ncbi:class I SAM-dependent methyltransferase [Pseudonocardia sp. T1-2H]|uniref:class I SAM-dependent methyltransferase n=1 Tax=Pseudonocardia sp. T1-2H TaxID=3128899 RepID=UPI0031017D8E
MSSQDYLFANVADEAELRFAALSALFDPGTFRHVDRLGIDRGWRCWEVGAGGASVPNWLAARAGPNGQVLATDIDTSRITRGLDARVEVQRHDVVLDDPPDGVFDLVHARLVLSHLPARDTALQRMASSLRPGGWLLIEDFDQVQPFACLDAYLPEHHQANKLRDGLRTLLTQRGADLEFARTLPRRLRAQGLTDVGADAYFPVASSDAGALDIANLTQVRAALISKRLASADDIAAHLAAIRTGHLDVATSPLLSAWARRPT